MSNRVIKPRDPYYCSFGQICGGQTTSATDFYKSPSSLYSEEGHLPICKRCLFDLYITYLDQYEHDIQKATKRICMMFDIYYNESVVESCGKDYESFLGKYFKALNLSQNRGKTFDNSLTEGVVLNDLNRGVIVKTTKDSNGKDIEIMEKEIPEDWVTKWGAGFDYIDYQIASEHDRMLHESNPQCGSNQEVFITTLCYTYMKQMKSLRDGDMKAFKELSELYIKLFKEAGLKTVKDTSETKEFLTGVTISTIEKYTPAEFYKNQKLYKDYDGIGRIITRFFTRPLKNLMFGTDEQDPEYSIVDGDENE
jgi:hypothetical protein